MNFYIDLEALQFSGRIISLGCFTNTNESFYTLMKPSKEGEKVNAFITNLTGITNEMLETAPTSEEAFYNFFNWIKSVSKGEPTFFFCYGNEDDRFLASTAKYIEDSFIKEFITNISLTIIDYSKNVNEFFDIRGIKLKRVWEYFYLIDKEQNHNALEDAKMLADIAMALEKSEKPKTNIFKEEEILRYKEAVEKQTIKIKALENSMQNITAVWASPNIPKGTVLQHSFNTINEAAIYFYKQLNKEVQAQTTKGIIRKRIRNAILNNKSYMGYIWTCNFRKEGDEANV